MAKQDVKDAKSYKFGYFLVTFIFKLIWYGTVKAFKNWKPNILVYSVPIFVFIIDYIDHNRYIELWLIPLTAIVLGLLEYITEYIEEYPTMKKRKYFNKIFEEIKLRSSDNTYPYFLHEEEVTEFINAYAFGTLIPLSAWKAKKELLEMHINQEIIDIEQDRGNNRIIYVVIKTNTLPKQIDWSDEYLEKFNNVLNIGIGYFGAVGINLSKNPHAFIAGETGSGKSNILKCLIYQAISKYYGVVLIDFKRGASFTDFIDTVKVYYTYQEVIQVFKELVNETTSRLDKFREAKVDNLYAYNKKWASTDYLKRKIIFIDELAELLKTRDKEISNILYDSIETLTRLSRAVGIHLIIGVQRPDSTIISGQIKNNVSYRVCGRFVDKEPSRIVLGSDIASTLPNIKGRFIVKDSDTQEIQSFYYTEDMAVKISRSHIFSAEELKAFEDVPQESVSKADPREEPTLTNELDFDFSDLKK